MPWLKVEPQTPGQKRIAALGAEFSLNLNGLVYMSASSFKRHA